VILTLTSQYFHPNIAMISPDIESAIKCCFVRNVDKNIINTYPHIHTFHLGNLDPIQSPIIPDATTCNEGK
jgi:hypothetical protein